MTAPNEEFLNWPGINKVSRKFLSALYKGASERGWDHNALAGAISRESGFNPEAKNPHATASGLIQMIDSSARAVGTSARALRAMSAERQLPYVFAYFDKFGRGRKLRGADFIRLGWGNEAANFGAPMDTILAAFESPVWKINSGFNPTGDITIQTLVDYDNRALANAKSRGVLATGSRGLDKGGKHRAESGGNGGLFIASAAAVIGALVYYNRDGLKKNEI